MIHQLISGKPCLGCCAVLFVFVQLISSFAEAQPHGAPTKPSDDLVISIAKANRGSIVNITADPTSDTSEQSGVVVEAGGVIVTVAADLPSSKDLFVRREDGSTVRAVVVALDHRTGTAVLKADTTGAIPYSALGDSTNLAVNEPALILDLSAEKGLVAARTFVTDLNVERDSSHYISVAVPRGRLRRGAPVYDIHGLLIGLFVGPESDGLVVPVNSLFGTLDQLGASSPSRRLEQQAKRTDDLKKKIQLLESSVRADPSNAAAWFYLAVAYGDRGDRNRQLSALERCIELRPGSFQAQRNLGIVYMDLGKLDLAVKHLATAVKLRPDSARVHNDLGEAYRRKEMYLKAKQQFEKALSLDPRLAEAHFNLGLIDATIDKDAAASAAHFQRYLDLRPDSPDAGALRQWMKKQTDVLPLMK